MFGICQTTYWKGRTGAVHSRGGPSRQQYAGPRTPSKATRRLHCTKGSQMPEEHGAEQQHQQQECDGVTQRMESCGAKPEWIATNLRYTEQTRSCMLESGDKVPLGFATLPEFLDKTKLERLNLETIADTPDLPWRLFKLGLAGFIDGKAVLTLAGLLLLGKDDNWQDIRQALACSDCCIQIVALAGDELGDDVTYSKEVYGDVLSQVDQASELLKALTAHQPRKGHYELYPSTAIREILVNVIVHRSYIKARQITVRVFKSSLCIIIPCEGGSDLEAMSTSSSPRNPVLAKFVPLLRRIGDPEAMFPSRKLFEEGGLGLVQARKTIEDDGGTLRYEVKSWGDVIVTITPAPSSCR